MDYKSYGSLINSLGPNTNRLMGCRSRRSIWIEVKPLHNDMAHNDLKSITFRDMLIKFQFQFQIYFAKTEQWTLESINVLLIATL